MNRYLEKKERKYVIATLTNPTLYLKKTIGKCDYSFVEDISIATKSVKKFVIQQVLDGYLNDTGLDDELVVVPIEISYEIIEE